MQMLPFAVLLLIPLGGPFVDASATAVQVGDEIEVELVVSVDRGGTAMVAHIVVGGDQPQRSVSLDVRAGGVFGGLVFLPIQDAVVVFELLGTGGGTLSTPTTLSELGVDFSTFARSSGFTIPRAEERTERLDLDARRWLWLAIGFGAAALSALAFWVRWEKEPGEVEAAEPDRANEAEPGY